VTQAQEGARLLAVVASTVEKAACAPHAASNGLRSRGEGPAPRYSVDRLLSRQQVEGWLIASGFAELRDGRLALTAEGLEVASALD
jgi:hypothetical protein